MSCAIPKSTLLPDVLKAKEAETKEQDHLDFFQQPSMWLKAVRPQATLLGTDWKQTQKVKGLWHL